MRGARVCVTGGAGFVGTELVNALLAKECHVLVVDDLSRGTKPASKEGLTFSNLDVRDVKLASLLQRFAPEVVVHLAAQSQVRVSVDNPTLDASVNVLGTWRALEAARIAGSQVFVFASSGGTVYGQANVLPTPEIASVRPLSPYGASKATGEMLVATSAALSSMRTVVLRLANVYGSSASAQSGVLSHFLRALRTQRPLTLFGDGRQRRDFVHVADVVSAMLRVCETHEARGVYNIGSGRSVSIRALAKHLSGLFQQPCRVRYVDAPPAEVFDSCLDAQRAQREFGWRPRISLKRGLRDLLENTGFSSVRHAAPKHAQPNGGFMLSSRES